MKRLTMLAAAGLISLLPSIASARPHFFFAFGLPVPMFAPFIPPPPPVLFAPPPVVVAAAPVPVCAAPEVYYAPAPFFVDYGYYHPRFYYRHDFAGPRYEFVRYHYWR